MITGWDWNEKDLQMDLLQKEILRNIEIEKRWKAQVARLKELNGRTEREYAKKGRHED